MRAEHLEILVEEPSMEAFLNSMLPNLIGARASFQVYPHQGKEDLLAKLPSRMFGYSSWLPENWRIVVVVDADDDDCELLKRNIEQVIEQARLRSRSTAGELPWQVVNRIAVEELEAWYFGDWEAVRNVYPKVSANVPNQAPYRDSDQIAGGTWEAFERVLQRHGYFKGGLRKIEAARAIGNEINPIRSRSKSFSTFVSALVEAVA